MENSVQFIQPLGLLQKYIENYYFMELDAKSSIGEVEQKPISNGCIEIFIGYQDTMGTCISNNGIVVNSNTGIVGIHNLKNDIYARALEVVPKKLKFLAINFKINGFYEIFKIPPAELYNGFFETDLVIGPDIKRLQILLDDSIQIEREKIVENFLIRQFLKNAHKDYRINAGFYIADFIKYNRGNIRIKNMISEFKSTERTIQRNFKSAIGLTPKEFCKISRFNHLLTAITFRQNINWMDMVNQYGYYDQTHLISEFKDATGITPQIFMSNKNKNIFKVFNHLVFLKPMIISKEIQNIMALGHSFN